MGNNFDETGRPAPPDVLEALVAEFRKELGLHDDLATFDVLQAAWRAAGLNGPTKGLQVLPRPDEFLNGSDAIATFTPPLLEIKLSKYREAKDHQPAARFLVAHELIHLRFHEGDAKHRRSEGVQRVNYLRRDPELEGFHSNESVEVQADQGARILLMPPQIVRRSPSPANLALCCVVPLKEAKIRFAQIHTGPKDLPPDLKAAVDLGVRGLPKGVALLWDALPAIDGEDPHQYRNARGWRVARSAYLLMTGCGWEVHQGCIRAYLDFRNI